MNWGLVGLGHFLGMELNVVGLLFGFMPALPFIIYLLVGVAGVMTALGCTCKICSACRADASGEAMKV